MARPDPERVLRVAHRAGNDVSLLAPAVAAGADLLEADVYTHRGRLEMRHARRLGPLPVLWEEPLSFSRPTEVFLADVAAGLPPGTELMLDLKGGRSRLGTDVRDAMERSAPGARYTVCGREWRALDVFDELPHVAVVHSVGTAWELARLPARLTRFASWGIAVKHHLLTAERVAFLRSLAPVVMTWPVDTPQEYRRVVALGVNGVISNDLPALPPLPAGSELPAD